MSTDFRLALTTFLNFADRVFSIYIPGTSWSFKAFFLSILCTLFVISIIKHFFENGININGDSISVEYAERVEDIKMSDRTDLMVR